MAPPSVASLDRWLGGKALAWAQEMQDRSGAMRKELLEKRETRRQELRAGALAPPPDTGALRDGDWTVEPAPPELLERRVELIGGCSRKELIEGLNAGAKSYVADLWNMTCNEAEAVHKAHRNIARAANLRLSYISDLGERVRINPGTNTRLMVAPRPLHIEDPGFAGHGPSPASFLDLAVHVASSGTQLYSRQKGIYFYLRGVAGHEEAQLWAHQFDFLERHIGLPKGSIRATVMVDSLQAVLEADEILYALRHHSAGLAFDPQGYAADHITLFSTPASPVLPDREHIGLDAVFLRSVSLKLISICHRRQAHAMGAPAFVLPPEDQGTLQPRYLEMIADKEREAVDGHDGTLVAHPGLVNPAMTEFNKSMPRAHQMYYQRPDRIGMSELVQHPQGELTTEGMQRCIRTVIKGLVHFRERGLVVQGGRLHDRSSVRLSMLLLWHWTQSEHCYITATGLEVHSDVMKFLIRKEGEKMFRMEGGALHERAQLAAQFLTRVVLGEKPPPELLLLETELACTDR